VLRGGKRSGTKRVPVTLAARSTEIGTLEIWCVAKEGQNRWRLEFNVRDVVKDPAEGPEAGGREGDGRAGTTATDVGLEAQAREAGRLIRSAYPGPAEAGPEPRDLTKALEAAWTPPAPSGRPGCAAACGSSWPRWPSSAAVRPPT